MIILPGDRVLVTCDVIDWGLFSWVYLVLAPQGSIARALSFEEYCELYYKDQSGDVYPSFVKQWAEDGEGFLFQSEFVAPCNGICTAKIGGLVVIDKSSFKKNKR
jgi:hypothetical protein